jgi:hypothetical protein
LWWFYVHLSADFVPDFLSNFLRNGFGNFCSVLRLLAVCCLLNSNFNFSVDYFLISIAFDDNLDAKNFVIWVRVCFAVCLR